MSDDDNSSDDVAPLWCVCGGEQVTSIVNCCGILHLSELPSLV
jgi:hypothetical protein